MAAVCGNVVSSLDRSSATNALSLSSAGPSVATTDVDASDSFPVSTSITVDENGDCRSSAVADEAGGNLTSSAVGETANIVMFGKDGTGKSALIVRFLTKRFIHEYDPTSEDVYAHNIQIDNQNVQLRLMDTAGQAERTVHERTEQTRWADGIVIVVSLTDRESLQEAIRIKQFIDGVEGPESGKPLILIANKRDLVHAREVTSREIKELADTWLCNSFETAATEDYNLVSEPFICLYREIRRLRERRGLFPGCQPLEKELVLQDVHKKYRSRLFTR